MRIACLALIAITMIACAPPVPPGTPEGVAPNTADLEAKLPAASSIAFRQCLAFLASGQQPDPKVLTGQGYTVRMVSGGRASQYILAEGTPISLERGRMRASYGSVGGLSCAISTTYGFKQDILGRWAVSELARNGYSIVDRKGATLVYRKGDQVLEMYAIGNAIGSAVFLKKPAS